MLNANKVRGLMAERRLSGREVATAIGIAPNTFYRKLKTGSFLLWEAEKLLAALGLPKEYAARLFFADHEDRDWRHMGSPQARRRELWKN